jgi:hypothetical protein
MSKENHFVAEVYNRLWPWIDHGRTLCFCLDDGGTGGISTPDLCFQFVGSETPVRIECKIIYSVTEARQKKKNHFKAYRKQLTTWKAVSASSPHIWIAKREDANQYYTWRHDHTEFLTAFAVEADTIDPEDSSDKSRFVKVPPAILNEPLNFPGLFFAIWRHAIDLGSLKVNGL